MTKSAYRLGSERRGPQGADRCPGLAGFPCGGYKEPHRTLCSRCRKEFAKRKRIEEVRLYDAARRIHAGQLGCPDGEACSMYDLHQRNLREWKTRQAAS